MPTQVATIPYSALLLLLEAEKAGLILIAERLADLVEVLLLLTVQLVEQETLLQ